MEFYKTYTCEIGEDIPIDAECIEIIPPFEYQVEVQNYIDNPNSLRDGMPRGKKMVNRVKPAKIFYKIKVNSKDLFYKKKKEIKGLEVEITRLKSYKKRIEDLDDVYEQNKILHDKYSSLNNIIIVLSFVIFALILLCLILLKN